MAAQWLMVLAVIGLVIPAFRAVEEAALLDECEAVGLRAGGFAARAACAVVVSKCPPRDATEDLSSLQDPDFFSRTVDLDRVLLNVVKDSCEVLFSSSCETAALWKGMDNGGSCASILLNGPAPFPEVPECPDFLTALDIFTVMASRLCKQNIPIIEPALRGSSLYWLRPPNVSMSWPGPQPGAEANIRFIARGGSGKEKIAGLLITGDNRVDQVIPIRCAETESGQLTLDDQECVSKVPYGMDVADVHGIKLIFANPVSDIGGPDHNIFIGEGQVWFRGRNIWRSAIDLTVKGVRENENGRLDALRLGSIYWNEGSMYIPPLDSAIWFEAKGKTGQEVVSVSALLGDGSLKAVRIKCSNTESGELREYYQICTGTLEAARKDVQEVRIYFNEEEGHEITVKNGQFFLDGINVLWNSRNNKLSIEDIWKMRSGVILNTGIVAKPSLKEYLPE